MPLLTTKYAFRCAVVTVILLLNSFIYCNKEHSYEEPAKPPSGFLDYLIPKGQAYSTDSTSIIRLAGMNEVKFKFFFDSSAIYTTTDPLNQADVNKLYGFADCVSFTTNYTIAPHHIHSARVGWAWLNNALRIYAYYYNDSVRHFNELQTVEIGKIYTAGIRLVPGGYEFTVENKKDTVPRTCNTTSISGYKLFPYFGGTEVAPHNIHVYIKEL